MQNQKGKKAIKEHEIKQEFDFFSTLFTHIATNAFCKHTRFRSKTSGNELGEKKPKDKI